MAELTGELATGTWGLGRDRAAARAIEQSPQMVRVLVRTLFTDNTECRKRYADVARRITDLDPTPLHPYADELAGLFASLHPSEQRTRWHLGLVVPRIANTHPQRLRDARLMLLLAEDEGNAVRCSAVEGLATLAVIEPSLRLDAEEMIEQYLRSGTTAMKCRARHAQRLLQRTRQPCQPSCGCTR